MQSRRDRVSRGGGFDERPSILLVEDNMTDVHMVLRRLRDEPYGVRHVRTGAAALELMRQEGFFAVLLDHRLPDMPGTKVCRTMRENGVTAPIMIISSLQDEALADAALDAGATDYLAKDIVMPHLARFLNRRLAMHGRAGPSNRPSQAPENRPSQAPENRPSQLPKREPFGPGETGGPTGDASHRGPDGPDAMSPAAADRSPAAVANRPTIAFDAMSVSNEEMVRRLASFGLPEHEAELYFHLARLQQAKAAELAHASGRRRPDVYPLLDRLADRGLVQRTTDRPAVYIPVDIATALSRLVERDRVRLDQLRSEAEELQKVWPAVRQDLPSPEERLAVHQGLAQINAILQERLRNAQHEILAALSPGLLHKLDGVPQVMAEKPPDCQVRILTMLDSAGDADALGPARTTCDVRHHNLPSHFEMVLVDGREAFIFLSAGRADSTYGTEEVALWLRSPDAALANQGIFDGLWGQATDLSDRLAEIKSGRPLGRIAVMRGRWIRCTRMREVIARAEAEIQCFAAAEEVAGWEDTDIHEWLRQRADEGVRVKVHVHGAEVSGVPTVPLSKAPAGTLVVADRREAVCAFPAGPGEGDHATQPQERSLWTTHPDLVQMLLDGCLHGQDIHVPV